MTANCAEGKALPKGFNLFGRTGILLFTAGRKAIAGRQVIKYHDTEEFLTSLAAARYLHAPLQAPN